jgi:hypothetical protein
MKNIFLFLSLLWLTLSAATCGKQEDPAPSGNTSQKASLLVRTWKVSKVTQTGQTTPLYQNPLPSGQSITEDHSRFSLSFTSTEYWITGKDGSSTTGTWQLTSSDTKLLLDKAVTWTVIELSNSSLKIIYAESSTKTGNRELLLELIPQ